MALADKILDTQAANLQAYWKCDESSGTTLADSSGNSNDLALTGGFTLGVSGPDGNAVSFDGVDGEARRASSVLGADPPAEWTILGFIKGPSGQQSAGTKVGFSIGRDSDLVLLETFLTSTAVDGMGVRSFLTNEGTQYLNTGEGVVFHDEWVMVAWRRLSDDTAPISVDVGRVVGGSSNASGTYNFNTTVLGGRATDNSQFIEASMQHVAVWDKALTESELEEIFHASALGPFSLTVLDRTKVTDSATNTHGQGVAYDGTIYYFSTNTHLYRFTRDSETGAYTEVTKRDTQADWPSGQTQINGIDVFDGKLWVGGNNHPTTPAEGWIHEYDPDDLTLIATHAIDAAHCEGGAWHDVGDGDQFWAVFHNTDSVSRWEFDGETFTKVDDFTLPLIEGSTTNGPQGAQWMQDDVFIYHTHCNADDVGTYRTQLHFHQWNGSGFDPIGLIGPLDPNPSGNSGVGQGIYWEKASGEAGPGDVLLLVDRNAGTDGTAGSTGDNNIVRATFNDDGEFFSTAGAAGILRSIPTSSGTGLYHRSRQQAGNARHHILPGVGRWR